MSGSRMGGVSEEGVSIRLWLDGSTTFNAGVREGAKSVESLGAAGKATAISLDSASASATRYGKTIAGVKTETMAATVAQGKMVAGVEAATLASQRSSRTFAEHGRSLRAVGSQASALGHSMLAMSVPMVAVGYAAVKMSATFSTELLKVQADAGGTAAEVRFLNKGILDMVKSGAGMGATAQQLAMGAYHLESLGIRGTKALRGLTLAAQASAISGANLEETTSAMGAAMFVGIKGTTSLDQVMGILNATVGAGNMRMGELVHALGTGVLPAAKLAGLSIQDVMAALAVFSDSGQNAASAAAQFATALHFIESPTSKADGALRAIGLTHNSLAEQMHGPGGMVAALGLLRSRLLALPGGLTGIDAGQVISAIFPGGRGRVLQTELVMLNRASQKYAQIAATAGNFQQSVADQRKNPTTEFLTAKAAVEGSLIGLGQTILPTLVPLVEKFAGGVSTLIDAFKDLPGPVKAIVGGFTLFLAVGGPILIFFGAVTSAIAVLGTALTFLAANPVVLIVAGIALLAGGLYLAYTRSKTFRDAVNGVGSALTGGLGAAVNFIINRINDLIDVVNTARGALSALTGGVIPAPPRIGQVGGVSHKDAGHALGQAALHAIPGVGPVLRVISGITGIKGLATGGSIMAPGLVMVGERGPEMLHLPQAARVEPLKSNAGGLGMQLAEMLRLDLTVNAELYTESGKLTDLVIKNLDNRLARR